MESHAIAALTAALAGRYDIEREIGAGGMATVYLARDVKHDRRVALKVLKPELGAVLGVDRFLGEIRVTANLQHPNLLPLFDSGEAGGLLYYVMPFVDGESLRARLDRERQLPIADAVHIATSIAGALDLAHRNGIIHRDLKPENILLREGEPVIADFGIALAISNAGGQRVTQTGLSLGTPQYMSPEQATGDRVIDGRADVYALGAVLYEMLTGEPPHSAATAQGVIAKLMTEDPRPVSTLRRAVPPHVEAAVMRALEKLPADRFATAREFAEALNGKGATITMASRKQGSSRAWLPWAVTGVAAVVAIIAVATRRSTPIAATRPVVRFAIGLGDHDRLAPAAGVPFAISPDERFIVYTGDDSGAARLMVRRVDQDSARSILRSNVYQLNPAISPDSKWVAVSQLGRIVRVPIQGGDVAPICNTDGNVAGIIWLSQDTIVASVKERLIAYPVNGGSPRVISTPDTAHGETAQWGPHLSGDGKRLYYVSVPRVGLHGNTLAAVNLDGTHRTVTSLDGTTIVGTLHDQLIWVTVNGQVVGAPETAVASNAAIVPTVLGDGVLVRAGGAAKAAMSPSGSLIFSRGESVTELVRVALNGSAELVTTDRRAFRHPRWSPDSKRIAFEARAPDGIHLWVYDINAKTTTRLTTGGYAALPEWSPDGTRIVYSSFSNRAGILRWVKADGSGEGGEYLDASYNAFGGMLTPDEKWILFRAPKNDAGNETRAMVVPVDRSQPARPAAPATFNQASIRLSPDGKFLSFTDFSAPQGEVYVRAIDGGPVVAISAGSGGEAVWGRDSRSLIYRDGRDMIQVKLATSPLAVVSRTPLFSGAYLVDPATPNHDLSPDGKSLLMVRGTADRAETIVVIGWDQEVKAKLTR